MTEKESSFFREGITKCSNEVYNKLLIYVSTKIIYWVIQATCFDLLTGHHQASSRISQRCC